VRPNTLGCSIPEWYPLGLRANPVSHMAPAQAIGVSPFEEWLSMSR
jgi:hypothetical protein